MIDLNGLRQTLQLALASLEQHEREYDHHSPDTQRCVELAMHNYDQGIARLSAVLALGESVLSLAKESRWKGGGESFEERLSAIVRNEGDGTITNALRADAAMQ